MSFPPEITMELRDEWTVDDVVQYLNSKGLHSAKTIFQEHGIEGKCFDKETARLLQYLYAEKNEKLKKELSDLTPFPEPRKWEPCEENEKIVHDPVYGSIPVPELCVYFMDTPQFQRLRDIKQLGSTHFVYPSSSHTRFEHSIGVCYVAGELVQALRKSRHGNEITDKDVLCIQIAALCHDLGHGPFSKLFETRFMECFRESGETADEDKWKHAMVSVELLDHMFRDTSNKLVSRFRAFDLNLEDYLFIREQIYIDNPIKREGRTERSFLYQVMATSHTDIDVCRWDYLARDCHHLGMKNSFDYKRFIRFARVIKDENGQLCIGVRDKEAHNVFEMYDMLHFLHRKVYQHRVVAIVDIMLVEAMMEAKNVFLIPGTHTKLLEGGLDLKAFMHLTDSIFHHILMSREPKLEKARKILEAIQRRERYTCIESKSFNGIKFKSRKDAKIKLLECLNEDGKKQNMQDLCIDIQNKNVLGGPEATPEEERKLKNSFYVQLVSLNFGDPVHDMRYYSKTDQNTCIRNQEETISNLIPTRNFKEQLVRVFHCSSMDEPKKKIIAEAIGLLYEKFKDAQDATES